MTDRSPLEPIRDSLRHALHRLGLQEVDLLITLMDRWDEIAGEPWAGVSSPVRLNGGELLVRADRAASIRLLRYATGTLLERLDEVVGEGSIASIRVVLPEA